MLKRIKTISLILVFLLYMYLCLCSGLYLFIYYLGGTFVHNCIIDKEVSILENKNSYTISLNDSHCRYCSEKLTDDTVFQVKKGYCTSCKEGGNTYEYCSSCGTVIEPIYYRSLNDTVFDSLSESQVKRTLSFICLATLVVISCAFVIYANIVNFKYCNKEVSS